jgi:hypothetical protein
VRRFSVGAFAGKQVLTGEHREILVGPRSGGMSLELSADALLLPSSPKVRTALMSDSSEEQSNTSNFTTALHCTCLTLRTSSVVLTVANLLPEGGGRQGCGGSQPPRQRGQGRGQDGGGEGGGRG